MKQNSANTRGTVAMAVTGAFRVIPLPGPVLRAAQRLTFSVLTPFGSASQSVSRSDVSEPLWPVDCSPPGSSVRGTLQARILEWVAISSSRGSSRPGTEPGFLHCRQILYRLSHRGSLHTLQDRRYFSPHFKIRKVRKRADKSLSPGLSDAGAWAVTSQLAAQARVL